MQKLLYFLLLSVSLFAKDTFESGFSPSDNPFPLANIEGEPSAVVGGHVNVITGDFVDMQQDLVMKGSEPLIIERSYCSSDRSYSSLCNGWHLNLGGIFGYPMLSKVRQVGWKGPHGRELHFQSFDKKNKTYRIDPKTLARGVTNNASGIISGKTHLKNIVIHENYPQKYKAFLSKGDGSSLEFSSTKHNNLSRLEREVKPNGMQLHYEYKGEGIRHIVVTNPAGKNMQAVRFDYDDTHKAEKEKGDIKLTLEGSDGQRINYFFRTHYYKNNVNKLKTYRHFLERIERPEAPTETYEYEKIYHDYHRVKMKTRPEGRYVSVVYNKNSDSPSIDRVKEIWQPLGSDASPVKAYTFCYHLPSTGNGACGVYDAHNVKTDYCWDKNLRLNEVVRYTSDGRAYIRDRLFWTEEGNLQSRVYACGHENLFCRRYVYDGFGNVTSDLLYGNITGLNTVPLHINEQGIPIENGCERYEKNFTYSQDGRNNLLTETEGTRAKHYTYLPGTDLVESVLTLDHGKVVLRHFYTYDEDRALTVEVIEDGSSVYRDDLTGTTYRKVRYLSPKKSIPWSVPEVIQEYCRDMATGNEYLEKKSVNHYDTRGKLTRQDIYGSDGQHAYSLFWEYDTKGRLIKEIDALGQTIERTYDENNNLTYEKGPREDYCKRFTYDCSNRLTEIKEIHSGLELITEHEYDILSRKIATKDHFGNKTSFFYDEFGRLIQMIEPAMPQGPPVTTMAYNGLGQVISKKDPNGNITTTEYTTRGQPCKITYPDGSVELFTYYFHGPLLSKKERNGCLMCYERDYQDRVLTTECFAPSGELLWKTSARYDAFKLLEETDAMGHVTTYTYDLFGRKIATEKGSHLETYEYDALGRVIKKRTFYSQEALVKAYDYDLLNRVLEDKTLNPFEQVIEQVSYRYEPEGKCNRTVTYTLDGMPPKIQDTHYNSLGVPSKATDPLGHVTYTELCFDHRNALNQCVPYTKTIDPLGNISLFLKDAFNRDVAIFHKNPLGEVTQTTELFYDLNGNLIKTTETVFTPNAPPRKVTNTWTYDAMNQVTSLTEALGTSDQKTTLYTYNSLGQLDTIEKPSGAKIKHTYHADGLLASYTSHDFAYHYTYDLNQRLLQSYDAINNTYTTRTYDADDHLIEEQLGNGLTLRYTHDRSGRITTLHLPDGELHYLYEGVLLKAVSKSFNGQELYRHTYDQHDYSFNILAQTLIHQAGTLTSAYDLKDRLILNKTAYTEESVPPNGYDPMDNLLKKEFKNTLDKTACTYSYDDLYQLIAETGPSPHNYQYDSLFNRVSKDQTALVLNDLNQVLQAGETHYSYDADGNMTQQGATSYAYDTLGRLTAVTKQGVTTTYVYDSFNRRLSKKSNGKTINFLYDGQNEIGAYNDAGALLQFRALGQGRGAEIGAAIAIELQGKTYAPIHDLSGNVIALINQKGQLAESYRYTAYGEEEIFDAQGHKQNSSPLNNPWRFSSKRVDETGLVYFGRRYYDPSLGRWTTQDPLGHEAGPNLYAYVSNRPLTRNDLYGLLEDIELPQISNFDAFESFCPYANKLMFGVLGCWTRNESSALLGLGLPEKQDMGIGFINGICNSRNDNEKSAQMLSAMAGGLNIDRVYNATHSPAIDALECGLGFSCIATNPVGLQHQKWDNFFDKSSSDAKYLEICHSQGTLHVRNALLSYPEERRQRILVLAIAPSGYIYPGTCADVIHYRAEARRDLVPRLDIFGAWRAKDTTIDLKSHPNAQDHDHGIASPTYDEPLRKHIGKYIKSGGKEI